MSKKTKKDEYEKEVKQKSNPTGSYVLSLFSFSLSLSS